MFSSHYQTDISTHIAAVPRVRDAWLVGVGKRAPSHGYGVFLVSPHGSLARLKSKYIHKLYITLKGRQDRTTTAG